MEPNSNTPEISAVPIDQWQQPERTQWTVEPLPRQLEKIDIPVEVYEAAAEIDRRLRAEVESRRKRELYWKLLKAAPRVALLIINILTGEHVKSWKTSLAGILGGLFQLGKSIAPTEYHNALDLASGLCVAVMGIVSKDSNVTGGTVKQ